MDNLKLLITNQWYSTIVRALSQVAGHQMDVEILTQEEIEARPQLKQKAVEEQETVLESSVALNPKYTFETFVVGSGNRVLPMPPRCPSPLTRLIPTTRCLSTAV